MAVLLQQGAGEQLQGEFAVVDLFAIDINALLAGVADGGIGGGGAV